MAFTSQQMRQLVRAVGPHRDLVLVNTYEARPWEAGVNRVIAAAARRYAAVVTANWFAAIEHRTGLLWPDEVHPRRVSPREPGRWEGAGRVVSLRRILKRCVRIGGLRCARRHRGGEAGAGALQPLLADGRQPLAAFPQVQ